MIKQESKYSHAKAVTHDKKICHVIYALQIGLIIILILSLAGIVLFTCYVTLQHLTSSEVKNFSDYLKLLGMLFSGCMGYIVLRLIQNLSTTSAKYLDELKKFNNQLRQIKSDDTEEK